MFNLYGNTEMYFGRGSRKNLVNILEKNDVKNILLVIGKNSVAHGIADMIYPYIDSEKYNVRMFNDIKPNPTIENVLEGIEVTKDFMPDIVITVGGGSVIDTAKAIAIVLTNPEKSDIRSLNIVNSTKHKCIPIVALPTTCGTGTEVTQAFVITDDELKKKMCCLDVNTFPIIAIIDSELMDGMPNGLAASTGMDALTHAMEAFVCNNRNAITDMYALKSIKLIFTNIKEAVLDRDEYAKDEMALAQYIAGYSFANSGLGLVHAMAHQLGGMYDLAHGLCNAILLPYVMRFNGQVCSDRFRVILKELGTDVNGLANEEIIEILFKKINALNSLLGTDKKLGELGVKEEDLATMADNALKDSCIGANIIMPTKEEIIKLYKEAM